MGVVSWWIEDPSSNEPHLLVSRAISKNGRMKDDPSVLRAQRIALRFNVRHARDITYVCDDERVLHMQMAKKTS